MSFCSQVKKEILENIPQKLCCQKAFLYGLLLFNSEFFRKSVIIKTADTALFSTTLKTVLALDPMRGIGVTSIKSKSMAKKTAYIHNEKSKEYILDYFGHMKNEPAVRLNRANIEDDCCTRYFLSGAFISCGGVTDPKKEYHLEFVVTHKKIWEDLIYFLEENDFHPKHIMRQGRFIIYFKESEPVEDVLTYCGATNSSLNIMNEKILKNIRNKVNRQTNCETANIGKMVTAVMQQLENIKLIEERIGLENLDENLRKAAILRRENPDISLLDLGKLFTPQLSRNSVNYNLLKIAKIARELKG